MRAFLRIPLRVPLRVPLWLPLRVPLKSKVSGQNIVWGLALESFFVPCFEFIVDAHGHAYAKQVRIMCVLSVPLLDQVSGHTKSCLPGQGLRTMSRSRTRGPGLSPDPTS